MEGVPGCLELGFLTPPPGGVYFVLPVIGARITVTRPLSVWERMTHDRYIEVHGSPTRYRCAGGGGEPVVLIHGLGSSLSIWEKAMPLLARRTRVYAMDLPGHGETPLPPGACYEAGYLADFLRAFLDTLTIERCRLVGLSLGGAVALRFIGDNGTERVAKLVLVASAGLGPEVHAGFRAAAAPSVGEHLTTPTRKGTARYLAQMVYDPSNITDRMIDDAFSLAARPGAQDTLLNAIRANIDTKGQKQTVYEPILAMLPAIDVPTLIVWGEEDTMIPLAHGRTASSMIPGAHLVTIPRCGHLPPLEHAEEFCRLVEAFLF
jgi:4,5:9,10-diseco-3-hydroxy-5,9,17-trioxoandrosta-1(10),2-diene-4-oate hydrolase